jgi:hypothetical protein
MDCYYYELHKYATVRCVTSDLTDNESSGLSINLNFFQAMAVSSYA